MDRRHLTVPDAEEGYLTERKGNVALSPTRVRLYVFGANHFEEIDVPDATRLEEVEAIRQFQSRRDADGATQGFQTTLWADVEGVHEHEAVAAIGRIFRLHPLTLEDIENTEQRAKLEDYEGYVYIVARMLVNRVDPTDPSRPFSANALHLLRSICASEQVSIVVGPGFVVSIQEADPPTTPQGELAREGGDVFESIRQRLRKGSGHLRKLGADFLAYLLLDAIVDSYFIIAERLGERVEIVEDEVIVRATRQVFQVIHMLRRDMLTVRRAAWPLRDVLSALSRGEQEIFTENTRIYLRDVSDHTVEVIDTVETLRDIVTGLLETYLSSVSNRLNEVMKVLTIISTIFMPLTFIVGVYGMNFERLYPSQADPYGFWEVMGVSLAIVLGMWVFFRRRGWL
jgi:magnesium transporter